MWLESAGLILLAFGVETARLPLRGYADRLSFKVYALDVGLLGALAGATPLAAGALRPPLRGVPRSAGRELRGATTDRHGGGRTALPAQLGGQRRKWTYCWSGEGRCCRWK